MSQPCPPTVAALPHWLEHIAHGPGHEHHPRAANRHIAAAEARLLRIARFFGEGATTVLLFVIAIVLHVAVRPKPLVFLERDLGMSYPLTRPETISNGMLFVISVSVPAACILCGHLWHAIRRKRPPTDILHSFLWTMLGVFQALALTFAIVNTLKVLTGRQRPNAFALCNYAGYRDALEAGDMTAYEQATVTGRIGDYRKCKAPFADVADSLRSFPSGHSAVSSAGMTFASLYLRASFGVVRGVHVSMLAVASTLPFVISAYVGISRVCETTTGRALPHLRMRSRGAWVRRP